MNTAETMDRYHRRLATPAANRGTGPSIGPVLVLMVAVTAVVGLSGCSPVSGDDGSPVAAIPPPVETGGGDGGTAVVGDLAPTTTVPVRPEVVIPSSWDSEIEAVFGRYWLYWEAFAAAHALPGADPSFGPLQELSTEENWDSLQEQLRGFAADGLVLTLPDRTVTEHLIRLPNTAVVAGEEGEEVVIQDCWINDFVQQTLTGDVVEAASEAKLMNVTMIKSDGQWRVAGVTRAAPDTDGYDQCLALSP